MARRMRNRGYRMRDKSPTQHDPHDESVEGSGMLTGKAAVDTELGQEEFALDGFHKMSEAYAHHIAAYHAKNPDEPLRICFDGTNIRFPVQAAGELHEMLTEAGYRLIMCTGSPPLRVVPLYDDSLWASEHGVVRILASSQDNSLDGQPEDVGHGIRVVTHDIAHAQTFVDWWRDQPELRSRRGERDRQRVSDVFQTRTGMEIRSFDSAIGVPLERGNYAPDVLDFYDKVCVELAAQTPCGRLVILDGPAGTGKTYLLRAFVERLTSKNLGFVYLPASMVATLDGPQMLSLIEDSGGEGRKVFIIEDADDCLVNRSVGGMSHIRTLLNYCDGFLGAMLDICVIATTNSGYIGRTDKIDDALLRPGRLLARAAVRALAPDLAAARIATLVGGGNIAPDKPMTLAEIYQTARRLNESKDRVSAAMDEVVDSSIS